MVMQWKCCKADQTAQTSWNTWLVKCVPWSVWSLRGVLLSRDNHFQKDLGTEETIACPEKKASVQCENFQTMTKTYLYPWDRGSCMKSICQTWNSPLGSLKGLGTVWTGFPGLYIGHVGQVKEALFVVLLMFPHQCWFMNAIVLSVHQWFNACTVVRSGNFGVSVRIGLLFGPNQSFLFLSNEQFLNFQSCFSFSEANCWASRSSFSKLSFGGIFLWIMTEACLLSVPLKVAFLVEISA